MLSRFARTLQLTSRLHPRLLLFSSASPCPRVRLSNSQQPSYQEVRSYAADADDGGMGGDEDLTIEQLPWDNFRQLRRNQVTLMGRLGSDINIRQTMTGKDVGTVSLAVDQTQGDAPPPEPGAPRDASATVWYRLTFWNDGAHQARNQVTKGSLVLVTGTLTREVYDPTASGVPGRTAQERLNVTVSELQVVELSKRRMPV